MYVSFNGRQKHRLVEKKREYYIENEHIRHSVHKIETLRCFQLGSTLVIRYIAFHLEDFFDCRRICACHNLKSSSDAVEDKSIYVLSSTIFRSLFMVRWIWRI